MKKILVFLITIFTFISCYSQDVTIEDFTTGTTLNSADYLPYWQSGVTKKISITNFNTWLNGTTRTIGGTWTFSNTITGAITGNAGTVTNGVYTTGSYNNPSWITQLAIAKLDVDAEDPGDILIVNSTPEVAAYPLSGDATINDIGVITIANNAVGTAEVTNGTLINEDISTSAAISLVKLAGGSSAQFIVCSGFGVPTYVTMSGDGVLSNAGVFDLSDAISDNIVFSDLNSVATSNIIMVATTQEFESGNQSYGLSGAFTYFDHSAAGANVVITDFTTTPADGTTCTVMIPYNLQVVETITINNANHIRTKTGSNITMTEGVAYSFRYQSVNGGYWIQLY